LNDELRQARALDGFNALLTNAGERPMCMHKDCTHDADWRVVETNDDTLYLCDLHKRDARDQGWIREEEKVP
jgi:hypothetical protein